MSYLLFVTFLTALNLSNLVRFLAMLKYFLLSLTEIANIRHPPVTKPIRDNLLVNNSASVSSIGIYDILLGFFHALLSNLSKFSNSFLYSNRNSFSVTNCFKNSACPFTWINMVVSDHSGPIHKFPHFTDFLEAGFDGVDVDIKVIFPNYRCAFSFSFTTWLSKLYKICYFYLSLLQSSFSPEFCNVNFELMGNTLGQTYWNLLIIHLSRSHQQIGS